MRFIGPLLLTCFALTAAASPALAEQKKSLRHKQFEPFLTRGETTWSIAAGLKHTNIEWNTTDGVVNIDDEQTWTDNQTIELKGNIRHLEPADVLFVRGGVHMEAELSGGITMDGRSRLSSYSGDNRTLESPRQTAGSVDGDAIGASVGVGYKIYLTGTPGWKARNIAKSPQPKTPQGRARKEQAIRRALEYSGPHISMTPILGYGIDQQTYHREDAYNHVALGPPLNLPVGPFHTESDYIANWYGPFFGLEGEIRGKKHMLRLRGEVHDLTFYGKGIEPSRDEDLEQDPTYDHEADGEGLLLKAEYAYALGENYAITFDGMYRERETDAGTYKIYPRDADEFSKTLNEVLDDSYAAHIGLRYNWD